MNEGIPDKCIKQLKKNPPVFYRHLLGDEIIITSIKKRLNVSLRHIFFDKNVNGC